MINSLPNQMVIKPDGYRHSYLWSEMTTALAIYEVR
jgi:hypothetical protein